MNFKKFNAHKGMILKERELLSAVEPDFLIFR